MSATTKASQAEQTRRYRAAEAWRQLEELCGAWQDGSQTKVSIFQDDATRQYILNVGVHQFYGGTLHDAVLSAARVLGVAP